MADLASLGGGIGRDFGDDERLDLGQRLLGVLPAPSLRRDLVRPRVARLRWGQHCAELGRLSDTIRALCHYGFITLGLRRLQVETVADNMSMIKAANRAGFRTEGLLRCSTWANGRFLDETILGQLTEEWQQS